MNFSVTQLSQSSAYLLVSHGSRDPRPQASVEQLVQILEKKLLWAAVNDIQTSKHIYQQQITVREIPKPLVASACLELSPLALHQQIQQFGEQAIALKYKQIQILPLFLLSGIHVMEDLPAQVAIAQEYFGVTLKIDLRTHLGNHPQLKQLLTIEQAKVKVDKWILLSHGSRRVRFKYSVEKLAEQLGAIPAYWAVAPSLETQIETLVNSGNNHIGILPYFLFYGGITDAIVHIVKALAQKFPLTQLHLADPIGISTELVNLIADLTGE